MFAKFHQELFFFNNHEDLNVCEEKDDDREEDSEEEVHSSVIDQFVVECCLAHVKEESVLEDCNSIYFMDGVLKEMWNAV